MSANRYLPSQVTLRVQGEIRLSELEHALKGLFEIYTDCTGALCLRTVTDGDAHRALLKREREARLEHAQRHAALVRKEGERNKANGYRAPTTQYRAIDCGPFEPNELRALPAETDDEGLNL